MRILFTGGSSFTGYWFIRALSQAGHRVVATFRRRPEEYPDELRRQRVERLTDFCQPVFHCSFGDDAFLQLVRKEDGCDLLCHHAADVTNYRSPDFNITAAVENNTRNLANTLDALKAGGCRKLLLTGSVFEPDEGAGSEALPAFSPYGVSKGVTAQIFRYHAARAQMALAKFVIPNPFGPYEEPRFTTYLMKTWFAGGAAAVNTPDYVRDNIHVSLLASAYAHFAARIPSDSIMIKINPSGYVESQGAFALRYAREMRTRLGFPCEVELRPQTDFSEPRIRINTDPLDPRALGWDEAAAWDQIAAYYQQRLRPEAA